MPAPYALPTAPSAPGGCADAPPAGSAYTCAQQVRSCPVLLPLREFAHKALHRLFRVMHQLIWAAVLPCARFVSPMGAAHKIQEIRRDPPGQVLLWGRLHPNVQ